MLYTPLHQAAQGGAPRGVVTALLKMGAFRSLKTRSGDTAYDIAKDNGEVGEDLLELLALPEDVRENEESILEMEKALHDKLTRSNVMGVSDILKNNGQQLPQISIMWEMGKEGRKMWFPVPGAGSYSGFTIERRGGELVLDGWSRVVPRSG